MKVVELLAARCLPTEQADKPRIDPMDPFGLVAKLAEQRKKAARPARTKPRLRRWNAVWECVGGGRSVLGPTPSSAYSNWMTGCM